MSGRGRGSWRQNPTNWNMWNRGARGPPIPPPMFRGAGFPPRGPGFFPPGPRPVPWGGFPGPRGVRGGPGAGPRGRGGFGKFGGRGGQNNWLPKKNVGPGKRLSEDEIGVTEYVSEHDGFNGIIKSRYSDFQVSEIDPEGNVTKLTDKKIPEPPPEIVDESEESGEFNKEILDVEVWEKINNIVNGSLPATEKVEVDVSGKSKEERTRIHDAVKKTFGDAIVGSTITTEDKKLVRFEKYRKGVRVDNRVKWRWPGEFVHFIVHKENCDTMDAASRIAERLNMPYNVKPANMGYAGTKDRRAKSSQWFSLRKVEPRKIAHSCKDLREIHVGNYKFSDKPLKLGMLKGNRFRIALRNMTADEELVTKACENLRDNGFINYYGLQRFGTRVDTPTYTIGLKLLKSDFRGAIGLILEPRPGHMQQALQHYLSTGNAMQSLQYLRRTATKTVEGRLLRSLSRVPNDLVGALNKLPRNARLLYVHSYQSLIWNKCASERLKRFGLKPAVGDLILAEEGCKLEENDPHNDEQESDDEDSHAAEETPTSDGTTDLQEDGSEKVDETPAKQEETKVENGNRNDDDMRPKVPVKILTQEDVESGKYTIYDIILPLPGYNIDYPTNMKEFYDELLAKDGVSLENRHKIKSYSIAGAYRQLVIKPSDMEWSVIKYTDPTGDLIQSDLDAMNNTPLTAIVDDGKYKALLVSFSLPASCYATMALRELLKKDTASDAQAEQNNYHNKDESNGTKTEEKKEPEDGAEVKMETDGATENGGEKRKLEDADDECDTKKTKTDEAE